MLRYTWPLAIVLLIVAASSVFSEPTNNSQINIRQYGGVAPLTGNGTTGTGSPRVTIASNNTAFPVLPASTANAAVAPHICGSRTFKHITTATDTQVIAASGSTNIYICDYALSFNGTGNLYLEKATSGTCATLTQIDQTWYGTANGGKLMANPYYQGLATGASAQLCAHTDAAITVDISVSFDQY